MLLRGKIPELISYSTRLRVYRVVFLLALTLTHKGASTCSVPCNPFPHWGCHISGLDGGMPDHANASAVISCVGAHVGHSASINTITICKSVVTS